METLEALQRKIATTEALHLIVKTMKALAAVNIRQYEKAVVSLQEYNRFLSGAKYQPHSPQLLPLDVHWLHALEKKAWPSPVLPIFTMNRDRLFSRLIRQYLFVALSRACAESLASGNTSRLVSLQNAEGNILERFDELRAQFHQRRQTEITGELLDIVAGFEALGGSQV
jgi:F-type H+-transporting ATPase subunit gamma